MAGVAGCIGLSKYNKLGGLLTNSELWKSCIMGSYYRWELPQLFQRPLPLSVAWILQQALAHHWGCATGLWKSLTTKHDLTLLKNNQAWNSVLVSSSLKITWKYETEPLLPPMNKNEDTRYASVSIGHVNHQVLKLSNQTSKWIHQDIYKPADAGAYQSYLVQKQCFFHI